MEWGAIAMVRTRYMQILISVFDSLWLPRASYTSGITASMPPGNPDGEAVFLGI